MIGSMLLGFGVAAVSAFILWESQNADKNLRNLRVRATMAEVDARIKLAALSTENYNCSTSATTTTAATCNLVITNADFQETIAGAKCPATGFCGISVDPLNFISATATNPPHITTKISYTGTEISLAPIAVDIEVPLELIQNGIVNCTTLTAGARPIFHGFNKDGSIICQALPTGCGAGEYVKSVDPVTLKITCGSFLNSGACPSNQYIASFDPMLGTPVCVNRPDPFVKFGGNSNLSVARASTSNPSRPGPDNCAIIIAATPTPPTAPVATPTPTPPVVVTPAPTPPVVVTPAPTPPVVVTPVPTPPVVVTPTPTPPVVVTPTPTPPVVVTPPPPAAPTIGVCNYGKVEAGDVGSFTGTRAACESYCNTHTWPFCLFDE